MGLEPTRSCDHRHLKPARLPIPPLLHFLCFSRVPDCLIIIQHIFPNVNTNFQKNLKNFKFIIIGAILDAHILQKTFSNIL